MERYFPADKISLTGNPVRRDLAAPPEEWGAARAYFGLAADKPLIFVFGGSLGALAINEAMAANAALLADNPQVQVLWQAGKLYYDIFRQSPTAQLPNVAIRPFIERMDWAYALANVVICRAGALTIAELCLLGKPAILIPSPNVAEDHQTKNARALAERDAAVLLPNEEASERIISEALALLADNERRARLARNARAMALPDAAERIAEEVLALAASVLKQKHKNGMI
jgi:UDP-N-acetylglucosamine--N-acetylmuramyl-(pentapeptide) pyrophosphoryl-undecaprenol N-acetylglucosamine transferase